MEFGTPYGGNKVPSMQLCRAVPSHHMTRCYYATKDSNLRFRYGRQIPLVMGLYASMGANLAREVARG